MLVHIKELQLLINHSYNHVSFILSVCFFILILCLKLCFQFSFLFLAVWKEKHYHMWELLHSQMILICICTVNLMDFWSANLRKCTCAFHPLLSLQQSGRTDRKLEFGVHVAAQWFMQLAWGQPVSSRLHSQGEEGVQAKWVVLVAAALLWSMVSIDALYSP